jgi:catechol 2,3-dioxygenase-like lactoylglutathione lyase family enzyme
MLDHLGIRVSDYAKARRFYESALAPLGYRYYGAFVIDPDGSDVEAVCHQPE